MSTLFFDKLIVLDKLDHHIKNKYESNEERQELWQMVEEIIHHKVMGCCLDHLPKEHHNEFLDLFHKSPYDENLLKFLSDKTKKDMKKIIKDEIKLLTKDLLLLDSHKV
jgi:ribonucleotide reductase alpha subunit